MKIIITSEENAFKIFCDHYQIKVIKENHNNRILETYDKNWHLTNEIKLLPNQQIFIKE